MSYEMWLLLAGVVGFAAFGLAVAAVGMLRASRVLNGFLCVVVAAVLALFAMAFWAAGDNDRADAAKACLNSGGLPTYPPGRPMKCVRP